jgi:ATP-dependent protease HslVU (ClpYQ) peptidase subunit
VEGGWELAADGRECTGDFVTSEKNQKIYPIKGGYIAAAGASTTIFEVIDWLNNGEDPSAKPKSKKFSAIIIKHGHAYWMDSELYPVEYDGDYAAEGHGWMFAWAALELGKTAKEAIKFASKFSVYTGGKIHSVIVRD